MTEPSSLPSPALGAGDPPSAATGGFLHEPHPLTGFSLKATSFCFKPLPPPYFLLFMGGKPLVSDQKDPKIHMAFQVEPTAEPLTSESSQKRHCAELPRAFTLSAEGGVWERPAFQNRGPATKATGLSAFRLAADQLGGDSGVLQG